MNKEHKIEGVWLQRTSYALEKGQRQSQEDVQSSYYFFKPFFSFRTDSQIIKILNIRDYKNQRPQNSILVYILFDKGNIKKQWRAQKQNKVLPGFAFILFLLLSLQVHFLCSDFPCIICFPYVSKIYSMQYT